MCLIVNRTATDFVRSLTGKLTLYKIFSVQRTENSTKGDNQAALYGPYQNFLYLPGETSLVTVVADERGKVHGGYHFCMTYEEAELMMRDEMNPNSHYVIAKIEVDIADICYVGCFSLATGSFDERDNTQAVVQKFNFPMEEYDNCIQQILNGYYRINCPDIQFAEKQNYKNVSNSK